MKTAQDITPENQLQHYPGSYFVDLQATKDRKKAAKYKKKGPSVAWKKDLKQKKKPKLKKERPPWRR